MTDTRILVVEPEAQIRAVIVHGCLTLSEQVSVAQSYDEALTLLAQNRFEIALIPLGITNSSGGSLQELCLRAYPDMRIILRCSHQGVMEAIQATREGVFAFYPWQNIHTPFLHLVEAAIRIRSKRANEFWRGRMVHRSRRIETLLDEIEHVSGSDKAIHITGPSGAGKRLAAEMIHTASGRRDGAFVEVDCRALVPELLTAKLFGQAAGLQEHHTEEDRGALVRAEGGVLLLHHIDAAPQSVQLQLAHALEQNAVRPLGSEQIYTTDYRVISTSDRRLESELDTGSFSEALYHQLQAIELQIPPLSERLEDIPLLVETRAEFRCKRLGRSGSRIDEEGLLLISQADWPGNVRQLYGLVDQLVDRTGPKGWITTPMVEQALSTQPRALATFNEARSQFERQYLMQLLTLTEGKVAQAARLANRNRTDFYKLLHKHNLEPKNFKPHTEGSTEPRVTGILRSRAS